MIWAVDHIGRVVYARIVRLAGNRKTVVLTVRDVDGTIYTTPRELLTT